MELIFKQGDTHNAIKATITKNDNPVSLKDCRVFISVSDSVFEKECEIVDKDKGIVAFPVFDMANKSGWYNYEFIIEYQDGTKEIVPNDGYKKLRIHDRIKE